MAASIYILRVGVIPVTASRETVLRLVQYPIHVIRSHRPVFCSTPLPFMALFILRFTKNGLPGVP